MEKQTLIERPKLLRIFTDMKYSLSSQEVIARIIASTEGSEAAEAEAKNIMLLMDQMSEAEVIKKLEHIYSK